MNGKKIYIGSDHAGFVAKKEVDAYLEEKGFDVIDLGVFNEDPYDYPDIAREVAEKVAHHEGCMGVLICGSGLGVCIAANKVKGVRAALVTDEYLAKAAREHNDANIIALGARHTDMPTIKKALDIFLETAPSQVERHVRRVQKLNDM
jgi:ribose 5-phosphate isomerase B